MRTRNVALLALWIGVGCAELAGLGDRPRVSTPDAAEASSGQETTGTAPADGSDALMEDSPNETFHEAPDAAPDASEESVDEVPDDAADAPNDSLDASDAPVDSPLDASNALVAQLLTSCLDVRIRKPDAGSGRYTIYVDGKSIDVHCNMDLGGGGWTTFFVNRLGYSNAFASFDSTYPLSQPFDVCPDPDTQCLRHLPSTVTNANQFAAMCGGDALLLSITASIFEYFRNGVSSTWQPLPSATALAGHPDLSYANFIYTGNGTGNNGWILSANDDPYGGYTTHTFASSYVGGGWDYCNGIDYNDAGDGAPAPMVWLFYR